MECSNIAKAFVAFQAEVPHIGLDATVRVRTKSGSEYTFDYATLGNIINTVKPILAKHKLAIMQNVSGAQLKTALIHESGESYESHANLPIKDAMTTQEQGATISYFRRYCVVCILGIVAEDDDDANIADGNGFEKKQKPATPPYMALKPPPLAAGFVPPKPEPPKQEAPPPQKPQKTKLLAQVNANVKKAITNGFDQSIMNFLNVHLGTMGYNSELELLTDMQLVELLGKMNQEKTTWKTDKELEALKGKK